VLIITLNIFCCFWFLQQENAGRGMCYKLMMLSKIPEKISFGQAAAVPVGAITAVIGL